MIATRYLAHGGHCGGEMAVSGRPDLSSERSGRATKGGSIVGTAARQASHCGPRGLRQLLEGEVATAGQARRKTLASGRRQIVAAEKGLSVPGRPPTSEQARADGLHYGLEVVAAISKNGGGERRTEGSRRAKIVFAPIGCMTAQRPVAAAHGRAA